MRNIVYNGTNMTVEEVGLLKYKVRQDSVSFKFQWTAREQTFKALMDENKWVVIGETLYDAINYACQNILDTLEMRNSIRAYLNETSVRNYRGSV